MTEADARCPQACHVCLIRQTNYPFDGQIRGIQQSFIKEGGMRERMTRARLQERNNRH